MHKLLIKNKKLDRGTLQPYNFLDGFQYFPPICTEDRQTQQIEMTTELFIKPFLENWHPLCSE
jgi:hypothetical protein